MLLFLPSPVWYTGDSSLAFVFTQTPKILIAAYISYLLGNLTNARLTVVFNRNVESYSAFKNLAAIAIGEFVDNAFFIFAIFIFSVPIKEIMIMIVCNQLILMAWNVVAEPFELMGLFKKFRKSLDKKQEIIRNHQNQEDFDLHSPDEDVRVKAISKIKDNDTLLDFALNDSNIEVRKKAVCLIDDEDILKEIAFNNPNSNLRIAALNNLNLKEEKVFITLAMDSHKDVRIAAINRISDRNVLEDIAKNESNREVRKIALSRIHK